ncbi:hypothetical protein SUGI_1198030 [Cryptomeria japonica]|nr:hypothetical protein SUGI_1198030 [Cryptomeria japonica]
MPTRLEFSGASPPFPDLYSSSTLTISTDSGEKIERDHSQRVVIGVAVGGSVTAAIAFILIFLLLLRRLKGIRTGNSSPVEKEAASVHLRKFSYRDLRVATRANGNFTMRFLSSARFKIMMDTAKALAFLHTDCDPPIIHGDIKPSNILLDGSFSARIADFGLARFKSDVDVVAEDLDVQGQARSDAGHRKRREKLKEKRAVKEESVITVEDDTKLNTDASVNLHSPETFASNSVTEDNPIFLSSNSASPEGLQYETDAVTENLDERTPSEMVDLEKNNGASMAEVSNCKDPSADCKSVDFSRDEEDKGSLSEGFDKASVDSGRPGARRKKDWWKRPESMSGEFSVKDYVMDWIGTEVKKEKPKITWGTAEERDSNLGSSRRTEKKKQRRKDSLEWWTTLEEKEKKEKSKGSRQSREWWREEYCEELSKKKSKNIREWWEQDMEEENKFAKYRSKSTGRSRDWLSRDWFREDQSQQAQRHHDGDWGSCVSVSSTPSTRGTLCYVAPEYGGGGILSEKSDVYSFAVVMLVIISGRRPLQVMGSPVMELERANLISWAKHLTRSGANMLDLVDASLGGEFDKEQALLCIMVALLCLQRVPAARPSMTDVVKILSGEMELPPLPVEFSPSPPYGLPFRSRRKLPRASSTRRHLPT